MERTLRERRRSGHGTSTKCIQWVINVLPSKSYLSFPLIKEPRRITLGHYTMQRRSGIRCKEVLKEDEAMYSPLLKTLEQLLNKDSILQKVSYISVLFLIITLGNFTVVALVNVWIVHATMWSSDVMCLLCSLSNSIDRGETNGRLHFLADI